MKILRTYQDLKVKVIDSLENTEKGDKLYKYINWREICDSKLINRLTEENIKTLLTINPQDIRLKRYLSTHENFSDTFIEENMDLLDITVVSWFSTNINTELLDRLYAKYRCNQFFRYQSNINIDFIKKYKDDIRPDLISVNKDIKVDVLEYVIDNYSDDPNINWFTVSIKNGLSKEFIIRHKDKLNIGALYSRGEYRKILSSSKLFNKDDIDNFNKRLQALGSDEKFRKEVFVEEKILGKGDYTADELSTKFTLTSYLIETYKDKLNMDFVNKYHI